MLAQGVLPLQFEEDFSHLGMTGLAGLPVYLDLVQAIGLRESIDRYVQSRYDSQGWTDAQMVTSLMLLNLAGGDCVEDLDKLQGDDGFSEILHRVEHHGMKRPERRRLLRRWRKARKRSVPSASSVRRYLSSFHDEDELSKRVEGKAFLERGRR